MGARKLPKPLAEAKSVNSLPCSKIVCGTLVGGRGRRVRRARQVGRSCGRVVCREQELHGDKRRYRIDDLLQMGKEKAWTKQIGYSFLNSCLAVS